MEISDETTRQTESNTGRLLRSVGIDRAIFYALLLRGWQLPAGLVSAILISHFFTSEVQGYYYTFASLTAMQSFFELNMFLVVINICSHEWVQLRLNANGEMEGDTETISRLVSLGRQLVVWFGAAAMLFALVVGFIGYVFFSSGELTEISWRAPWLLTVLGHALLLCCLPLNAMLEGCNQVATVYRFRVIQAVAANLVVWVFVALGGNLWTAVGVAFARLAVELYLLTVKFRRFFSPLRSPPQGPTISWQREVWPMQWRLGMSGVFSYFIFFLFTPVLFKYHGAEVAGRMGMTFVILTALQAAALSWVQTKTPKFGMLVAAREYDKLDSLFFRMTWRSVLALVLGGSLALIAIVLLNEFEFRMSERLLDPFTTGLFLLAFVLYQIPCCQAIYVRAHKREPLVVANMIFALAVSLTVWWCGAHYGARAAAWGYLTVIAGYMLPCSTYIWWQCRKDWHSCPVK